MPYIEPSVSQDSELESKVENLTNEVIARLKSEPTDTFVPSPPTSTFGDGLAFSMQIMNRERDLHNEIKRLTASNEKFKGIIRNNFFKIKQLTSALKQVTEKKHFIPIICSTIGSYMLTLQPGWIKILGSLLIMFAFYVLYLERQAILNLV